LRTFHYIKSFATAGFSDCHRYLQPASKESVADGRWKKAQMHKFSDRTSDRLRVRCRARSSESKEQRGQEEIWAALVSHDEGSDITSLTQLLFISL